MTSNGVLSIGQYEQYRLLCHGVKDRHEDSIREAAVMLAAITPSNSVLIPIPSHQGFATYMLDIALKIASINGCRVCNCLASAERMKLYDAKMAGANLNIDFHLTSNPSGNLYLIDNCIDTGRTYAAARRLLGDIPMITIATTN